MHCLPGREAVAHVEESRGCEGGRGRSAGTNQIIVVVIVTKMKLIVFDDGEGGAGSSTLFY